MSLTPDVRRACLQKGGEIHSSLSLSPSLSLFATRKSSALYSEQEAGGGGFLGRMHITLVLVLAGSLREMP